VPDTEPPAETETVVEPTMVPLKLSPALMATDPLPTKIPEMLPPAVVRMLEPMTPELPAEISLPASSSMKLSGLMM